MDNHTLTVPQLREAVRTARHEYNEAHERNDRAAAVLLSRKVDAAEKALRDKVERR